MILLCACGFFLLVGGCGFHVRKPEISPSVRVNDSVIYDPYEYLDSKSNLFDAIDEFMLRFNWKFK